MARFLRETRTRTGSKPQVIKDEALCSIMGPQLPPAADSYTDIFARLDTEIQSVDSRVTQGALSNAHGDWYEWLLAIEAWNLFCDGGSDLLALLPNVAQFNVARLYEDRLFNLIEDLKAKVSSASTVELVSSNPDFAIIDKALADAVIPRPRRIEQSGGLTTANLRMLQSIYSSFSGRCTFQALKGYLSVKTSFRPDRRLQIPHEGSLMKAIYIHLQTREWIMEPPGLKYYAMATAVGDPDRNALNTVATHSITTVHSLPEAAVDEVFEVNSGEQARYAFSQIL